MESKKNTAVVIVVSVVIILAAGYAIYWYLYGQGPVTSNIAGGAATTTIQVAPGVQAEIQGGVIPSVPGTVNVNGVTVNAPKLDRPVVIPPSYTLAQAAIMKTDIQNLVTALSKDPSSYADWNDLAIRRKMINDYEGAREIWVYLTQAAPTDSDAFLNLGDLEAYYFHDNNAAEAAFLGAVAISPHWLQAYQATTDFYANVLQNKGKAAAFLSASIAKTPDMKTQLEPLLKSVQ